MINSRPTIRQIAEAAGVSTAVVSAVVNGKENQAVFVSQVTKSKVQAVVRKMNYVPSRSARNLRSQKTDVLGVIFNSLNPYHAELLEALQKECFRKRLEVLPYVTNGDVKREDDYLRLMSDGRVDGVIICAKSDSTVERIHKYAGPPFNLKIVTTNPAEPDIASVHTEESLAGPLAADHLIEQGRKNLGFFGGMIQIGRAESFFQTVRERGLKPCACVGDRYISDFIGAQPLAAEMLDRYPSLDGVFCHNDEVAVALVGAAMDRGVRVPEDLAIVGYDNSRVCLYARPAISSIDTHVDAQACAIVAKLTSIINKRDFELHTVLKPDLIVRASSSCIKRNKP